MDAHYNHTETVNLIVSGFIRSLNLYQLYIPTDITPVIAMFYRFWGKFDTSNYCASNKSRTDYNHLFKLVICGPAGVGKSNLFWSFADESYIFSDAYEPTIGVDFRFRTVNADGQTVKLQIWDTAGQEMFQTIVCAYFRGAHSVIIVFSVDSRESFENIKTWLSLIEQHCTDPERVCKMVIGNKCDIPNSEREIPYREAQSYCDMLQIQYIETSAQLDDNVTYAFHQMIAQLLENRAKRTEERDLSIQPTQYKSGKRSCLIL